MTEKKRRGSPTLTIKGVAEILGISQQMVHSHVAEPPEHRNHLPSYVNNGTAWVRREYVPPEQRKNKNTRLGYNTFIYEEDLKEWMKTHPPIEKLPKPPVKVTQEQEALIIKEAEKLLAADGYVTRTKVYGALRDGTEEGYGPKCWTLADTTYTKIRQVLDNHGYEKPPNYRKRDESNKRSYPGKAH